MEENKIEHHRVIVRISYEFLRDILFPENTEILSIDASIQNVFGLRDFVCCIESPDLPVAIEGKLLPEAFPQYRRHYTGAENEIPTVEFEKWIIRP